MTFAVVAEELRKRYGDTEALAGFDLTVPEGTVHGLLGPNGAGKSTAVRILTTLLRADSGRAEVAGLDVATRGPEVRHRIGLVGQNAALDEILNGRQNLEMFGRLHHLGARQARARATDLLEQFALTDAENKPVGQYSGGMRRRLDLAAGMILMPAVLFLDEPTTGLDPRARAEVWESVRALVTTGTTVLLTTQYLEEADHLAGRVCVIDSGRTIANGTPDELKGMIGGDRIDLTLRDPRDMPAAAAALARVSTAEPHLDPDTRRISAPVHQRITALTEVVRALDEAAVTAEDIAVRRPTLDEVFLHLTGTAGTPQNPPRPDHHSHNGTEEAA